MFHSVLLLQERKTLNQPIHKNVLKSLEIGVNIDVK